ncbi:MAG TPA: tRNA (5-methylaminomethyl-2-thiouridine)(34)-methyltransferase MnmD, partial [Salinimicrobium sp.]|nr:tRNA (5-methylaminomethyl-2-thiouridine)(34)-methyltransferase MnmD [Salinimicrobium sp.]
NEHYHSRHGAIQEANHVFIKMGLEHVQKIAGITNISILEIGFGTGLNAFITFLEAEKRNLSIKYTGVEAFPVLEEEIKALNYVSFFTEKNSAEIFDLIHQSPWEVKNGISEDFFLTKQKRFFSEIDEKDEFQLIYFDAFGPQVQPELWTEEIFKKMHQALKIGGILVTYSAKGSVRRAMQAAGFFVERLPGPPGKREMLRATKI